MTQRVPRSTRYRFAEGSPGPIGPEGPPGPAGPIEGFQEHRYSFAVKVVLDLLDQGDHQGL